MRIAEMPAARRIYPPVVIPHAARRKEFVPAGWTKLDEKEFKNWLPFFTAFARKGRVVNCLPADLAKQVNQWMKALEPQRATLLHPDEKDKDKIRIFEETGDVWHYLTMTRMAHQERWAEAPKKDAPFNQERLNILTDATDSPQYQRMAVEAYTATCRKFQLQPPKESVVRYLLGCTQTELHELLDVVSRKNVPPDLPAVAPGLVSVKDHSGPFNLLLHPGGNRLSATGVHEIKELIKFVSSVGYSRLGTTYTKPSAFLSFQAFKRPYRLLDVPEKVLVRRDGKKDTDKKEAKPAKDGIEKIKQNAKTLISPFEALFAAARIYGAIPE